MSKYLYFSIPLGLFIIQAIYTLNSFNQIRIEELIVSVRNVFWLQNHLVFNGAMSDLGWYGQLLFLYKIFGFHLYLAKFLRLGFAFFSLYCLAAVLKNYLGIKRAWLPLVTIGLSPTLLYFNVLQVQYGVDLQYFPIVLYLAMTLNFKKVNSAYIKSILLASFSMIAWMSYPAFIFYLPVLAIIYFKRVFKQVRRKQKLILNLVVCTIAFILPLILSVSYVKNRELLWNDPLVGRGMFRSNGTVDLSRETVFDNFQMTITDLFESGISWHFEAKKAEFSDYYPIVTLAFVLFTALAAIFKGDKFGKVLLILILALAVNFIVMNLTGPSGGIRRGTVILVIFYALFTFVWARIYHQKNGPAKTIALGMCAVLLIHHVISYPVNLNHLKQFGRFREDVWFAQAETPAASLALFVNIVTKSDLTLICRDQTGQNVECKHYSLIYPAIAGSCVWNNLNCKKIIIYDGKLQELIPLTIDYWGRSSKGV